MKTAELVRQALTEDLGSGDITTEALIGKDQTCAAVIRAKENGVICGLEVAAEVFRQLESRVRLIAKVREGRQVKKGQVIATLAGPARAILTGERTALNFLQHLSGIATLTRKYKLKMKNEKLKIKVELLDTRKTIPGLRLLEKYAVKCGGGTNHRIGLYDAVLIKDNHIKLAGGVGGAIKNVKLKMKNEGKSIEIETKTLAEVKEAVELKVDRILLDNMDVKTLRQAVAICKKAGIKTEASGGVNLKTVAAIAKTGVDYISVGALTHSAPALDISLEILN
jgi:nicotinate-nucleotide pyrophosphorylase (carboxylating)